MTKMCGGFFIFILFWASCKLIIITIESSHLGYQTSKQTENKRRDYIALFTTIKTDLYFAHYPETGHHSISTKKSFTAVYF